MDFTAIYDSLKTAAEHKATGDIDGAVWHLDMAQNHIQAIIDGLFLTERKT